MKIKINGNDETLTQDNLTITELLKVKEVQMPEMVSVEHNGEILDRQAFASTIVKDGDQVEFLYFMGGGQCPSYMCPSYMCCSFMCC